MTARKQRHDPPCPGPEAHTTRWGGPSCTGHSKQRQGAPCGAPPVAGQTVCAIHGGKSPQAKKAAAQRLELAAVEADAKKLLAHRGNQPITDPLGELARLASEVVAFKDAIAARLNALERIRYESNEGSEQLRSEVTLYERALDRTGKFLEVLIRAGFEERMVRVNEQLAAQILARMNGVYDDLDLTPEQRAKIPAAVERHFTIIPGELA